MQILQMNTFLTLIGRGMYSKWNYTSGHRSSTDIIQSRTQHLSLTWNEAPLRDFLW